MFVDRCNGTPQWNREVCLGKVRTCILIVRAYEIYMWYVTWELNSTDRMGPRLE